MGGGFGGIRFWQTKVVAENSSDESAFPLPIILGALCDLCGRPPHPDPATVRCGPVGISANFKRGHCPQKHQAHRSKESKTRRFGRTRRSRNRPSAPVFRQLQTARTARLLGPARSRSQNEAGRVASSVVARHMCTVLLNLLQARSLAHRWWAL